MSTMSTVFAQYPQRPEKDIGSPETGVLFGFKLPSRCWDSDPCPPEEQAVLPIAEPSSHALFF